jgi:REP element-mobilizing transposase RayT
VYLHIVFSTKHRAPLLTPELTARLYPYLAATALGNETLVMGLGGMPDHVHLLLSFGRTETIADTVKALKGSSSRWINDTFGTHFAWQSGYGAFSVGYPELGAVKAYIANQEERHRGVTYQDEFRQLLTVNGKSWDERFVWD